MATSYLEDKSKYRAQYADNPTLSGLDAQDYIGRRDYLKVSAATASGIDVDDAGTILV